MKIILRVDTVTLPSGRELREIIVHPNHKVLFTDMTVNTVDVKGDMHVIPYRAIREIQRA